MSKPCTLHHQMFSCFLTLTVQRIRNWLYLYDVRIINSTISTALFICSLVATTVLTGRAVAVASMFIYSHRWAKNCSFQTDFLLASKIDTLIYHCYAINYVSWRPIMVVFCNLLLHVFYSYWSSKPINQIIQNTTLAYTNHHLFYRSGTEYHWSELW